jgi:predicted Fe-S protein YdhL (DUF1289 family)
MMEIESPCTKLCVIENEHCAGCLRTVGEIANWLLFTETERDEVMVCLEDRKRQKLGLELSK